MTRVRLRILMVVAVVAVLAAGCGDKVIALKYAGDSTLTPLSAPRTLTVYQFKDARGDEGEGDPMRVGGIYGGYGNRLSKVNATAPFQQIVVDALVDGFKARGVRARGVPDKPYQPGTPVPTALALWGELSTEARFTNAAHIGGFVRLYDASGKLVLEKPVSIKEQGRYGGGGVLTSVDDLQMAMNEALVKFVRAVVTDPELAAQISDRK
jgi:hypothetical protein